MKTRSAVAPHIFIESDDPQFRRQVEDALAKLQSGPTGRQLVQGLAPRAARGHDVTIKRDIVGFGTALPILTARQLQTRSHLGPRDAADEASRLAQKRTLLKGPGTRAEVHWNPSAHTVTDPAGKTVAVTAPDKTFIGLGHELIHARRIVKGTFTTTRGADRHDPSTRNAAEERRAVGLAEFKDEKPSENSIRAEHGEPPRRQY